MNRILRRLILGLALLLFAVPVAWTATFMLSPFWGWFEHTTGIESLGHSGPSDWCFFVDYAACVALALLTAWWLSRVRGARDAGPS